MEKFDDYCCDTSYPSSASREWPFAHFLIPRKSTNTHLPVQVMLEKNAIVHPWLPIRGDKYGLTNNIATCDAPVLSSTFCALACAADACAGPAVPIILKNLPIIALIAALINYPMAMSNIARVHEIAGDDGT